MPAQLKKLRYKTREEAVDDHKKNYRSSGRFKGKFDPEGPDRLRIIKIKSPIKNGSIVLDCGGNDGSMGHVLQKTKRCVVHAIDPVAELVIIAQAKGILAREGIVEEIPYRDNKFDAVVMAEVMEHLYEPRDGLKEIHRVMKPEGVFTGSVPHADGGLGRTHVTGGDFHQSIFETEELKNLLSEFFEEVEVSGIGYDKTWCMEYNVPETMYQWNCWICRKKRQL